MCVVVAAAVEAVAEAEAEAGTKEVGNAASSLEREGDPTQEEYMVVNARVREYWLRLCVWLVSSSGTRTSVLHYGWKAWVWCLIRLESGVGSGVEEAGA